LRTGADNPKLIQNLSCSESSDCVSQNGGTQWRWSRPESGYGIRVGVRKRRGSRNEEEEYKEKWEHYKRMVP
jgi:hypothetical protein